MTDLQSKSSSKPSRRQVILEALACQLEEHPGERITTAALARQVGVSEAALYRHFPSKAKMFEGLIEFIEDSVFGLITRIMDDEPRAIVRCERILQLILGFAARNPGLTRLLTGDALVGETERLRQRIGQFYERLETQLKQVLREGEMNGEIASDRPVQPIANLLVAIVEGKLNQFVRSGFKRLPLELWEDQWELVRTLLTETETTT